MPRGRCLCLVIVTVFFSAVLGIRSPAFVSPSWNSGITSHDLAQRKGASICNSASPLFSGCNPSANKKRNRPCVLSMRDGSPGGHPAFKASPKGLVLRLATICAAVLHCAPRTVQAADLSVHATPVHSSEHISTTEICTQRQFASFASPEVQDLCFSSAQVADVQAANSGTEWKGVVSMFGVPQKLEMAWEDLGDWAGYKLSQVLSSTALRLLTITCVSVVLIVLGGWMLMATGVGSWKDALFKSYALLNNAPGVSIVDEEDEKSAFAVNTIFFVGILTFAVVIGIVTASIEEAIDSVLAGDHRVVESGHIVMLNWNKKTVPMLKQIQAATSEGRVKDTAVVILSGREREEMEEELRDEFPDKKIQVFSPVSRGHHPHVRLQLQKRNGARVKPKPVPVVTRSGSPTYLPDLLRVSAGRARHVVIVPPEDDDSLETLAVQTSCLDVLQRARQPKRHVGSADKDLHVVISDYDQVEQDDLQPGPVLCPRNAFTERAVASALSQEGVMEVYNEILDQDRGHEIYLRPIRKCRWLVGKPFSEVVQHFKTSVPLGWVDYTDNQATVVMNPKADAVVPERSSLLVLADDDSSIRILRRPNVSPLLPALMEFSHMLPSASPSSLLSFDDVSCRDAAQSASRRSWSPSYQTMRAALSETPRHVLVLNFDPDTDPLEEIDESLPEGSTVAVLSPDKVSLPKPKHVKMQHWVGDPFSLAVVDRDVCDMDMSKFDSVVISAGTNVDEGDSKVMGAANVVMKAKALTAPDTPPLRLITSFHNQEYAKILQKSVAEAQHLVTITPVLSTKLEAGALIQILWNPDMRGVYEELLDPEGAQVVMVNSRFFAPPGGETTFGEIADRTVESGGVAMGFKDKSGRVSLCPARGSTVKLGVDDKVIALFDPANAKAIKTPRAKV